MYCIVLYDNYNNVSVFEDTELSRGVQTVEVAEGLPIVLRCNHYVSVPRATISWYSVNSTSRDNWSIVDQVLVTSNDRITVDDRGTCTASSVFECYYVMLRYINVRFHME